LSSPRYRVLVPKNVARELKKLPRDDRSKLFCAIEALASEPRPPGCVKLKVKDLGEYRVRESHWRILYDVDDEEKLVSLIAVKRRGKDTYKK
jgi:mRNA interferase RelE/StbE